MHPDIEAFNKTQGDGDREICATLAALIDQWLPEGESRCRHRYIQGRVGVLHGS